MKHYAIIEKNLGETPLQALEHFRLSKPELADVPLTYAGRLDPMAQGKLLILIGEECKQRARYDKLDKEYTFEILLGYKTDSGDLLGLVERGPKFKTCTVDSCTAAGKAFVGRHRFPYPAFSSKKVAGKQLFQHAHDGTLDSIEIPQTDSRIYKIYFAGMRTVSIAALGKDISDRLALQRVDITSMRTGSDFRKEDIYDRWRYVLGREQHGCTILTYKATVSAGTYIRTLSPLIAEKLGTYGLAYSIQRTKIGRYVPIIGAVGFWQKNYKMTV